MPKERDLTCPKCGKLLGKTTDSAVAALLRLWCRRCKASVVPTVLR